MSTGEDVVKYVMWPSWSNLVGLIVLFALLYKLFFSCADHGLPPGPRGLPVLGNLLSLDPELHSHLAGLARTHGPILKLWLGYKLCVAISSPTLARQVLKDKDVVFANRDVQEAGRPPNGVHDVVWTPYGHEWRMLRKVCVLKMLSNATLDSVYHLRRCQVRNTVAHFYSRVGSRVDLGHHVFLAVLNVITNMLWGGTVDNDEERQRVGSEFRELVSRMTALLGKPNLSDFYPGLALLDLQGVAKSTARITRRFNGIFDKLIAQRNGQPDGESKDFLQYLLKLMRSDEQDRSSKTPLTMAHVKALLLDMVVGGSDTSSNSIEFAMAEIINQPEIMRKAQQELDLIVGRDNIVEESHIHRLPYLQAVMKEALRLHPALPLMVPHSPSEDCSIGGYTVPKGSRVLLNVWAIHRDPSIWDNPLKFDPNRFMNDKSMDFRGNDFSFIPFGSGRKICAGVAMAERMVLYTLATLLHSFNWEIPAGDKLDLSEKFGIVLKKKTPLVAIPAPRLSHPELYSAQE